MAKKVKRTKVAWTKAMQAELRKHSKARTPVAKISKQMKRTVGALRQQAFQLGIGPGASALVRVDRPALRAHTEGIPRDHALFLP
jgi:hypothetical protein